jgi:toxin ParE1/3/4
MNLLWSPEAIADLLSLRAYLAQENPTAGRRMLERIRHDITNLLPENPHIGRPGRVSGTRELVITRTPYIVPYRVLEDVVQILGVYHGARRWPDSFD